MASEHLMAGLELAVFGCLGRTSQDCPCLLTCFTVCAGTMGTDIRTGVAFTTTGFARIKKQHQVSSAHSSQLCPAECHVKVTQRYPTLHPCAESHPLSYTTLLEAALGHRGVCTAVVYKPAWLQSSSGHCTSLHMRRLQTPQLDCVRC